MTNPQLENGYTKIANEILQALIKADISGQCFRLLILILRKTYGFNKLKDYISLSQMVTESGIGKIRCSQVIKRLACMKILTVNENINGLTKNYSFNKDYSKWSTGNENINRIEKTIRPLIKNEQTVNKNITHKINIQKKYTKEIYTRFEEIWEEYPNPVGKKQALKHFNQSVLTEEDFNNIKIALNNYKKSKPFLNGYIQNGSTWFNNWKDWLVVKDIKAEIKKKKDEELFNKLKERSENNEQSS